jgi:hypothetical protein
MWEAVRMVEIVRMRISEIAHQWRLKDILIILAETLLAALAFDGIQLIVLD